MKASTISLDNNELRVLDSLRGLAALYVLIHHARLALTQSYHEGFLKHPEAYEIIDKVLVYFFSLFKFGHQAVLLFFVLSGFVIHLQQVKKGDYAKLNIRTYFFKRILRIYPTLIFAFILSFGLDAIYAAITKSNYLFSIYSLRSLWENLLLIPGSGAWGLNYPIWSLKHEWFFYLVYPFLYMLTKKNQLYPLILAALLFLLFLFEIRIDIVDKAMYTLLIWCLGMWLAEIYVNIGPLKLGLFIGASFFGGIMLFTPLSRHIEFYDLFWGLIFAGLIAFLLKYHSSWYTVFLSKFSFLGEFSYSMYLLHFPMLLFIQNMYFSLYDTRELPYHYWLVIGSIIVATLMSFLFYCLVEKPSKRLKNKFTYKGYSADKL